MILEHRSTPNTSKAWILPDGSYAVCPSWHYLWLKDHQRSIKKWVDLTSMDWSNEQDPRLAAVNAGFIRINLDFKAGLLDIEYCKLNPNTKAALEDLICANRDQIHGTNISKLKSNGDVEKKKISYYTSASKDILTSIKLP